MKWSRCTKCGQSSVRDPLADAVKRALWALSQLRRTTNPDEIREFVRDFRFARSMARSAWKELEAEVARLVPDLPDGPEPPRPAEYRAPTVRRDPPPPAIHEMAEGRFPAPDAFDDVDVDDSPTRRLGAAPPRWPVPPDDEFRQLVDRLEVEVAADALPPPPVAFSHPRAPGHPADCACWECQSWLEEVATSN